MNGLKHKIVSFAILFYSFWIYSNYCFAQNTSIDEYQFISPVPNSSLNQSRTSIIIRDGDLIDESTMDNRDIIVEGSKSGIHVGDIILAKDFKTIIFKPTIPFVPGEAVYIKFLSEVKTKKGRELPSIQFSFEISDRLINKNSSHLEDRFERSRKILNEINVKKDSEILTGIDDLPEVIVNFSDKPSP
ncbi:MAG: hypothetical protein DRI23_09910, partial [Candidatus Cloacimonadota bacterium]